MQLSRQYSLRFSRSVFQESGFDMKVVKWTAFGCFGLAAFLGAGVVVLVTGVSFFAAHLGLSLMTDIRNALVQVHEAPKLSVGAIGQSPEVPRSRAAAEIAADIAAMKLRA